MNYIRITDYYTVNGSKSHFIATELTTNEVASKIYKLQETLVENGCINNRMIVDMDTVLKFFKDFFDIKVIDDEKGMINAVEEGQHYMVNDMEVGFWEVDIAKAALNLYKD